MFGRDDSALQGSPVAAVSRMMNRVHLGVYVSQLVTDCASRIVAAVIDNDNFPRFR